MSRYSRDRDNAEAVDQWSAPLIAHAIDYGLLSQWPWEIAPRAGSHRSLLEWLIRHPPNRAPVDK